MIARDRILSARGLDDVVRRLREAEVEMADEDPRIHERGMKRWTRADAELHAGGGYAAESEAAQMAAALGIEERILAQPIGTLSGGQRRRVELARILFSGAEIMLLDEPTNHLDADSIVWLRDFLKAHRGGFVVISHDNALLEATVNKVFHLDANRAVIDVYNMGWHNYLTQREDDEKRRKRERMNAENKAKVLTDQANKMRAKATKAQAAQSMLKRAEKMMAGIEGGACRPTRWRGSPSRSPRRAARPRSWAPSCRSPTARSRSSPPSTSRSTGAAGSSSSASTAPARRRCCGSSPASTSPTPARSSRATGSRWATTPRSTRRSTSNRTVLENMHSAAPELTDTQARSVLGSFLFSGDDAHKPAGVLSGGEKTRLALAILVVSSANVLLLDEPTNNLDPASREEVLHAIRSYTGAIILVTHDEGAVRALDPDRVLLLPDGDEDLWNEDYADLVSLA